MLGVCWPIDLSSRGQCGLAPHMPSCSGVQCTNQACSPHGDGTEAQPCKHARAMGYITPANLPLTKAKVTGWGERDSSSFERKVRNHMAKGVDTGKGEELGLLMKSSTMMRQWAGYFASLLLTWILMVTELFLSHVTSDKTLALSTPHFSHLYNRRNNHFS